MKSMLDAADTSLKLVALAPSHRPLADQLALALADAIIFGDISPGQRLTEDTVERWSGASRSPVREAFRLLERDRLVRREAHRGVTVTQIEIAELDDLYRLRIVLEAQAAGLAAERAVDSDIALLERRHQLLKAAFEGGDQRCYHRASVAFSEAVHAAAHHALLQEMLRIAATQALRFRFLSYHRQDHFTAESLAAATRILDAIRAHDIAQARALTEAVICASWDEISLVLDNPVRAAPLRNA